VCSSDLDGVEAEVAGDGAATGGAFGGPTLPLGRADLAKGLDPLRLPAKEGGMVAGELGGFAAIDQQTDRQVDRIAHHVPDFDVDSARREIALFDRRFALAG